MPIQDYFEFPTAYDPRAGTSGEGRLVASAEFQVYLPTDLGLTTPLRVFEAESGAELSPLRSNSIGMLPSFRVEGDPAQVIIRSGTFATLLLSKFGVVTEAGFDSAKVDQAIAAATASAEAKALAEAAATEARGFRDQINPDVPGGVAKLNSQGRVVDTSGQIQVRESDFRYDPRTGLNVKDFAGGVIPAVQTGLLNAARAEAHARGLALHVPQLDDTDPDVRWVTDGRINTQTGDAFYAPAAKFAHLGFDAFINAPEDGVRLEVADVVGITRQGFAMPTNRKIVDVDDPSLRAEWDQFPSGNVEGIAARAWSSGVMLFGGRADIRGVFHGFRNAVRAGVAAGSPAGKLLDASTFDLLVSNVDFGLAASRQNAMRANVRGRYRGTLGTDDAPHLIYMTYSQSKGGFIFGDAWDSTEGVPFMLKGQDGAITSLTARGTSGILNVIDELGDVLIPSIMGTDILQTYVNTIIITDAVGASGSNVGRLASSTAAVITNAGTSPIFVGTTADVTTGTGTRVNPGSTFNHPGGTNVLYAVTPAGERSVARWEVFIEAVRTGLSLATVPRRKLIQALTVRFADSATNPRALSANGGTTVLHADIQHKVDNITEDQASIVTYGDDTYVKAKILNTGVGGQIGVRASRSGAGTKKHRIDIIAADGVSVAVLIDDTVNGVGVTESVVNVDESTVRALTAVVKHTPNNSNVIRSVGGAVRLASNRTTSVPPGTAFVTMTMQRDREYVWPLPIGEIGGQPFMLGGLGFINVTAISGGTVRLGLRADSGTGRPGRLIVDAGAGSTAVATSVAALMGTAAKIMPQRLWGSITAQGADGIQVRAMIAASVSAPAATNAESLSGVIPYQDGVSGALPIAFSEAGRASGGVPRLSIIVP